ncbi:extracellular solute-binding protein [Agromyces sp. SYSU T0242]|uniref:extracellular solute-binding protein n=1 Tax=Agromyces litoreus TaxID=3158561 RepID=UPI00339AB781
MTVRPRLLEIQTTRRRLFQLAIAGAGTALLAGCGSSPRGSAGAQNVYWQAIPPYSLQGTDPNRVGYLTDQLAAFESASGWNVEPLVTSADTTQAMAKLVLQASQGRAPDISQVDGYLFGRIANSAQPLDEAVAAAGLSLDDWLEPLRPNMTGPDGPAGGIRALQFTTDVRVLYYRKDLVSRPPASWEEVLSMAGELESAGAGVTLPAGRSEGAVTTTLWPQYWAQGHELFDADGEVAFAGGAAYDAMAQALGVVDGLIGSGVTPQRVATFGKEDDQNTDIVAGRTAMFVGGNWQATALDNLMADEDFFEAWGVAPIPTVTGQDHRTSAGGWVWAAFSEDPEVVRTGTEFVMDTFVDDDGMAAWCSLGGYLPPRASVYDHPDYQTNPFTETFREHLAEYAQVRPGARNYAKVSDAMQVALSSVAAGIAEPEQALDQALIKVS